MDQSPSRWLPPVPAYEPAARGLPPSAPSPPGGPPPALPPSLPPKEQGGRSGLQRVGGMVLLIGALVLKFGKTALVALKGAKFLTTSASMLVSIGAYALIWGWQFGVGIVALLFLHEMGHYIQLRREGVQPSGMLFIPFLGAVIGARSLGGNAVAEARVGLAGPVLGSLAAAACIPLYLLTDNQLFQALAFTGFFLNLFNLLPVVPLDGGRAMAAMAPWMWLLGLGAIVVLTVVFPNPVILLILLFAAFETYRRWKARREGIGEEGNPQYYAVTRSQRVAVGAVYVGLIVALVVGMDATHLERTFSDA